MSETPHDNYLVTEVMTAPPQKLQLMLVEAAIRPLPYHDIAGTCGRDEDCRCLSCWVRELKESRQQRIAARESRVSIP